MVFLVFLASFAYLLYGLSGTIPSYRDSGDLIASLHTLGIAHPPGYSVYILLGKAFDALMPVGNAAYHVNVLSAVSIASAAALLSVHMARRPLVVLPSNRPAMVCAIVSALAWVSTPAVTELGRVAEMYATAALWSAGLILVLSFDLKQRVALAAFVWTLGLSVHPILLFVFPFFFVSTMDDRRGMLCGALLGLSIFLFLPIRAAHDPWLNWGNPSTWRNFWRVVTRADYGGLKLHPEESVLSWSPEDVFGQTMAFFRMFWREWHGWGMLVGMLGAVAAVRQTSTRTWALGCLSAWAMAGPVFVILSNLPSAAPTTEPILQPYFVLTTLLWAPFVATGLLFLWAWRPWLGIIAACSTVGVTVFYAQPSTHRSDFYAYDYGHNLLRSLPPRAVLYDPDDPTAFTVHALQATEHLRQDVTLLNFFRTRWGYDEITRRSPELLTGAPIHSAQELEEQFWSYSVHQRPFFVELPQKLGQVPSRAQGIAYAVRGPNPSDRLQAERNFALYVARGDTRTTSHPDFFTQHVVSYYAAAHSNFGLQEASEGYTDSAVRHYQWALTFDPTLSAAYNNWAIVEFNARHYPAAIALYQKALRSDPSNEGLRRNLELAQSASSASPHMPRN